MGEARVIVIPRKPNGRKRTGGGYVGRSKKRLTEPSFKLSARTRQIAECLAERGWGTLPELAQAAGIEPRLLTPRLSDIRRRGSPEFSVARCLNPTDPGDRLRQLHGGRGRQFFFRVERTNTNASD